MKYFQVVCILGYLLAAANSLAGPAPVVPTYLVVSGTNDSLVDGTYAYNGDYFGKPSWAKGDYVLRWGPIIMDEGWKIENTSSGEFYYSNMNNIDLPWEVNWSCQTHAAEPCIPPVVTEEPLPDTLYASGTVDTFLSGAYTRSGLNLNGYPRYTMGYYEIYNTGVWSNPWIIENMSDNKQYYFNEITGASMPEGGWAAAGNATGPPYVPPVVTAEPLPDKLYVSGTVDDFLNGEYTRGLNGNGCPLYSKGYYVISRVEWGGMTMGKPWTLEDTSPSSGNVYYDCDDDPDGIRVPERNWYKGFSAGSPTSPPVVSEKELPDRYKVSGAGSSEVNGIYERTLNSFDGLVYEKEKDEEYHLEAGYYLTMAYGYGITKSSVGTYYSVEEDSLYIPSIGWVLGAQGTANPPYVIPYTFPWHMFLPSFTSGK